MELFILFYEAFVSPLLLVREYGTTSGCTKFIKKKKKQKYVLC